MNHWGQHLAWALAGAVALMLGLWFLQRRTKNAGIVDVGWAFGIGALTLGVAVFSSGAVSRRVLVVAMTVTWSVRLGFHLLGRVTSELEDGRYKNIRDWAGERQGAVLLIFFLMQATWVVLFALPQYIAMQNPRTIGALDVLAIAILAVSLIGESIADRQLSMFRKSEANKGEVCQVGLWRYSRHPNYFFEWLHWFAYPVLAIGMGHIAWLTLVGPVLMLFFLLKITGIPPTEKRALQSRGERYREYQRTTSAFIPWFPRNSAT